MASFTPLIAGNEEEIRAPILEFCKLWNVEEIQDEIQVEFSTRLTHSLGRTQPLQKLNLLSFFLTFLQK